MDTNLRIAILGAGGMGEAIIGGLLRNKLVEPNQIVATGPRAERRNELAERYQINTTADNVEATHWANVTIFAVKPQTLPKLLPELRGSLGEGELVISLCAGVPLKQFVDGLEHQAVVRSMPNTPAQIGAGMTVWTATSTVTEQQQQWARAILGSVGQELFVNDENYLDMATALNGTGPAYVFMMLESLIDAGVHMGLPRYMAEQLAEQTVLGAIQYAIGSDKHVTQLRNAVTSPGGTTAAALYELERGGLRTVLSDAVWAAYRRSRELGQQK